MVIPKPSVTEKKEVAKTEAKKPEKSERVTEMLKKLPFTCDFPKMTKDPLFFKLTTPHTYSPRRKSVSFDIDPFCYEAKTVAIEVTSGEIMDKEERMDKIKELEGKLKVSTEPMDIAKELNKLRNYEEVPTFTLIRSATLNTYPEELFGFSNSFQKVDENYCLDGKLDQKLKFVNYGDESIALPTKIHVLQKSTLCMTKDNYEKFINYAKQFKRLGTERGLLEETKIEEETARKRLRNIAQEKKDAFWQWMTKEEEILRKIKTEEA